MAMYIPPGRRRRRLLLAVGAAVVVGVVVGAVIGRMTAPTVEDRVADVRESAAAALAQLEALPLEYGQQLSGDEGFEQGGVDDALDRASDALEGAIADAPWLTGLQIDAVRGTVDDLRTAARARVTEDELQVAVDAAIVTISEVLGSR